jgi:hypothetical protein
MQRLVFSKHSGIALTLDSQATGVMCEWCGVGVARLGGLYDGEHVDMGGRREQAYTPTQPTPRSPPSQPVRHSSDSSSRRRVANPSQCNSCQLQVGLPPLATTLSPTLQLLRSPPLSSERLVTRKPLLQTLFFPSCHRPLPPPLLFQQKKTNLHHPRLDHGRSGLALSSNPRPLPKKT